jgi:hypothetical protein
MYLARYAFDGDPAELEAGHRRMLARYPADPAGLHFAIRRVGGLDVYDACPDAETFQAFSTSSQFADALSGAGLPRPRIEGLGEVVDAQLNKTRS